MNSKRLLTFGAFLSLGACVAPSSDPPPRPQPPAPAPAPAPAPTPPPPPAAVEWPDLPLSPGLWTYRDDAAASVASFGPAGTQPSFAVRCDKAARQIVLIGSGVTSGNMMTIRTSFGARNFPISVEPGSPTQPFTRVAANDPFLDSIAFSRGRFSVEVPGAPMLIIPAWPEPARVVEDCRAGR